MNLIFFRHLNKLINQQKYIEILIVFLDLDYQPESLKLIHYSLNNNYDIFIDFISYLAFLHHINFNELRYFTDKEELILSTLSIYDEDYIYDDDYERYLYYKNKVL